MQPLYKTEVDRSTKCHDLNREILTGVLERMEKHLVGYRKGRQHDAEVEKRLPEDPAGIYILIDGQFTVKSEYNFEPNGGMNKPIDLYKKSQPETTLNKTIGRSKGDGLAHRPESMDVVGAEKFLQVQGYTYYGCLYASSQQKAESRRGATRERMPSVTRGGRDLAATVGSTVTSQPDEPNSASSARVSTVCGFVDAKLLHLLPFYDLYVLKDDLQDRYNAQCRQLKRNCEHWYSDILGRLK